MSSGDESVFSVGFGRLWAVVFGVRKRWCWGCD